MKKYSKPSKTDMLALLFTHSISSLSTNFIFIHQIAYKQIAHFTSHHAKMQGSIALLNGRQGLCSATASREAI
jgi:hypothetical protein